MVSQPYKDLIAAGAWARDGDRETPEDAGLTRADGWTVAFEQIGSGQHPQREVFNGRDYETDSGCIDVAGMGVPQHDMEVDYTPASDAACFVTTASGLWLTRTNTGPSYGNATDPETDGQQVWQRY